MVGVGAYIYIYIYIGSMSSSSSSSKDDDAELLLVAIVTCYIHVINTYILICPVLLFVSVVLAWLRRPTGRWNTAA
jgi:hypothetical protein